jgi:hypothetical protein
LQEATDLPVAAAEAMRSNLVTPADYSVYGSLLLKGAVGAATLGDRASADEFFREAMSAAEVIGDRNDYWLGFGPTNMAIHAVWLALENGDPSTAIDQAAHVPYDSLPNELSERRTSHLITVAWAHYLKRQYDEALAALFLARASAPEQLIFTHRVHNMLRGMLRNQRRLTSELREMADFVGIAA